MRSEANAKLIVHNGFDFRLCGSGASGRGSYFATDASYSNNYADSSSPYKSIFVARVALGRVHPDTGHGTMRPPDGFDSVASGSNFVVFDNRAALPEYVVYYS